MKYILNEMESARDLSRAVFGNRYRLEVLTTIGGWD